MGYGLAHKSNRGNLPNVHLTMHTAFPLVNRASSQPHQPDMGLTIIPSRTLHINDSLAKADTLHLVSCQFPSYLLQYNRALIPLSCSRVQ